MVALCDTRTEIRMPALMRAQLDKEAAARGWTSAAYIRDAIRRALEEDASSDRRRRAKESSATS